MSSLHLRTLQCLHSSYIHMSSPWSLILITPHLFGSFLVCCCITIKFIQLLLLPPSTHTSFHPSLPSPPPFYSPSLSPLHTDCSLKEENESPFAMNTKRVTLPLLDNNGYPPLVIEIHSIVWKKIGMGPRRFFFCRCALLLLQSTSKSMLSLLLFSLLLLLLLMKNEYWQQKRYPSVRPPCLLT